MPWRLIFFVIVVVLATIFVGFNLGNACDVSLIFHDFKNVPVFITIIVSFLLGIIVMLPFAFGKKNRKKTDEDEKPAEDEEDSKTIFKIRTSADKKDAGEK